MFTLEAPDHCNCTMQTNIKYQHTYHTPQRQLHQKLYIQRPKLLTQNHHFCQKFNHILPKPTTSTKTPPVPVCILQKSFSPKLPPPQKEVRKSLVNPNLKIPQTLPPLDLSPPDTKETIETYRPPDETLF